MVRRSRAVLSSLAVTAVCATGLLSGPGPAGAATGQDCGAPSTQRVSVSSSGGQADDHNSLPAISGDGRYVAFDSSSSELVPGDTNGAYDVFVRDRVTGATDRVSVSSTGAQGNDGSVGPQLSGDGRYVAFNSGASNLVPGDTNGTSDVFVRDRLTGTTERVSVSSSGGQGNRGSGLGGISADGRYVAFTSPATNLVPDNTNQHEQVYVHDRLTGTTELASVSSTGAVGLYDSPEATISADGRYVAFTSVSTNLVPESNSGWQGVFVHDRVTGATEMVNRPILGTQGNGNSFVGAISADGRYVAYTSYASNQVRGDTNFDMDVFVRDRATGRIERVSVADDGSQLGGGGAIGMSADGRYVAFSGTWDVLVRDRVAGRTQDVSVSSTSAKANGPSSYPAISADGRFVAFLSEATNLVTGDTNGIEDVFVRDRGAGSCSGAATAVLDWKRETTGSDHGYGYAAVRVDGDRVCFGLRWTNLATPTGADIDPVSAVGTVAVRLFAGTPGPNSTAHTAWGCVVTDSATAADLVAHPDHYAVNVRTAEFPADAIAGTLQGS